MKKFKVGLQLFSVRDDLEKDMDATLGQIKAMGYDYVEFAGYYGKSAEEVKALLDKHDLKCLSVHQAPTVFWEEDAQAAIDYLKVLGVKYCAIPWYTVDEFFERWDETIEKFTELGKKLKENGIQLLYHNHDFEFKKINGEVILDKMYATIPNDILQPEFDTCWIHYAGNNPAEYLKKYVGKIDIIHLKDFVCEKLGGGPVYGLIDADGVAVEDRASDREDNGFMFKPVGSGIQDWPAILAVAEEAGADYVIVEQDQSPEREPLESAKMSREYLKTLGL